MYALNWVTLLSGPVYCFPLTMMVGVPRSRGILLLGSGPLIARCVASITQRAKRGLVMQAATFSAPLSAARSVSCASVKPGEYSDGCCADRAVLNAKKRSGAASATHPAALAARCE